MTLGKGESVIGRVVIGKVAFINAWPGEGSVLTAREEEPGFARNAAVERAVKVGGGAGGLRWTLNIILFSR